MEQAPRARVRDQETARVGATPGTETVLPRGRMAEGKAGEPAKGPVAVRVKARAAEPDREAVGNLKTTAAVGGYIMLRPQGVAHLPPLDLYYLVEPETSKNPGPWPRPAVWRLHDYFQRLSIDPEH